MTNADHYRKEFFQEAREILDKVGNDLLEAEANPDNSEVLNGIFRGIHTIKGSAGTFDLGEISDFTHHLEGILNGLRDGRLELEPNLVDLILGGVDRISAMIEACEAGTSPSLIMKWWNASRLLKVQSPPRQ